MKNLLTICFATLFLSVAANAEVVDTAGMFSSSALTEANQRLEEVKRKSGKELVIETIEEVGQADANALALEKAKARRVNGVYVLISKKDRKLKVEIGNKTKEVFGDSERNILKAKFTEEFKNKNFDRGLSSSVEYFAGVMNSAASNTGNNRNYPQRSEMPIRSNQTTGGFPWMTIIIFAVLGFIAFKVITSLMSTNRGGAGNMNQPYGANGGYGSSGPGFMGTFLTGMLGAAAGSWLYDKFTGHDSGLYGNDHSSDSYRNSGNNSSWSQSDSDYSSDSSDSGSDWGGGDSGGSDW
ncbi:MAG TPA: TPM domain-containing protein [Leptospiraceae bacterium]|nr:TPM domain-containing protein [Leptospiraceae bacterium]HRG76696.1 TPM domain-containing protein [Leptospiraceae bacterium]